MFAKLTAMGFGSLTVLIVATTFVNESYAGQDRASIEPLTDRAFHVLARSDIAFAAVSPGLKILDLSKPAKPAVLSVVPLPRSGTYVLARENLAVIAREPAGVYAINVSDPSNPTIVSRFDTPGSAMMLDLSDNLLAVADGSMGVALFDLRDVRNPKPLPADEWPGGYCRGVKFHSRELYACAGRAGVIVLKVDEREKWRVAGSCVTAGDARDIAFHERTAIVADGKFGLTALDVSDPKNPRVMAKTPVTDSAHGVAAYDGFVYAVDGIGGVGVFRLRGSAILESVARLETARGYANKVVVHGKHLLVANDVKGVLISTLPSP